jgi:hypothetical protein
MNLEEIQKAITNISLPQDSYLVKEIELVNSF